MLNRAVIVGAGHNGLVAAAYLARAGLDVTVFERRPVVGGAAVTEEIIPGFRASSASYSLSLLRPDIYQELELARHGLEFYPKDPQMFLPLPDGRHFFLWRDESRSLAEIERIAPGDADGYRKFNTFWEEAVALLRPAVEATEPPSLDELRAYLAAKGREEVWRYGVAGSAADVVSRFFSSEEMRGAFASQGIIGTARSVYDPGTAWVMAYHYLGGELNGAGGTWAYVRGGMSGVSDAIAGAAREAGAEISVDSPVQELMVEGGRAAGVILADGRGIPASVVISNLDPKRTFLSLVPDGALDAEFLEKVRRLETKGCVLKLNAAISQLPNFTARPGAGPQHAGTIELSFSLEHLDQAFTDAAGQGFSTTPFMEVFIQSVTDPNLAPAGKHVLSAFTQYVSTEVATDWAEVKASATESVLDLLESLAPGFKESILAMDVLGPPELEERFGLTDGDIFHGQILPEQSFAERLAYRTPLAGLYLCGSGASPGGGVMGAAGRNAAKVILQDVVDA